MLKKLQIISIHSGLGDNTIVGWHDWEVHSAHERAIILIAEKQQLITLTNTYNGPSTMLTHAPLPLFLSGGSIGKVIDLDFSGVKTWIPPRFSILPEKIVEQPLDQLLLNLQHSGKSALLRPKLLPRIRQAILAIATTFPQMTKEGSVLIGLGPGMTPAGDDFMSGFFHVLYHAGLAIEWTELAPYLAETNWFAQSMLWWACKGVVAQPFEEALIGVYLDQPNLYDLIQTALTIGHSSGADHLLGVWLGLLLVRKAGLAEILIKSQ